MELQANHVYLLNALLVDPVPASQIRHRNQVYRTINTLFRDFEESRSAMLLEIGATLDPVKNVWEFAKPEDAQVAQKRFLEMMESKVEVTFAPAETEWLKSFLKKVDKPFNISDGLIYEDLLNRVTDPNYSERNGNTSDADANTSTSTDTPTETSAE